MKTQLPAFVGFYFQLAVVILCYALGLAFFCRGFLLTRQTLPLNSTCAEVQYPSNSGSRKFAFSDHDLPPESSGCWIPPRFRRAVFIIVDALRYDFVLWHNNSEERKSVPYQDKLPTVWKVLSERRSNSLLFRFVADPPTTTLQRLKGLTTGTLPTFIDAGSNFAGAAITEDNVIDQLVKRGRNITFMGDDTWSSLFPGRFSREYPFPSFDVKDLHTVDDGILSVLYEELAKPDWQMLIAHFLGVDHCGHKYGPNHPEMTKKLAQMNQVVANVTGAIENDTVLFVFGDHGMTQTGDHGGDSPEELGAALFAYSPAPLHNHIQNLREPVSQVDLVPTLSLLLDAPVPFSNLGRIMPEFFPENQLLQQASRANAWQVVRYAEAYGQKSSDGSLARKFDPLLKIVYSLDPEEFTPSRCLEIVGQFHGIFEESWAKFHNGWMTIGLLTILENLLWSVQILWRFQKGRWIRWDGRRFFLKICSLFLMVVALLREHESVPPVLGMLQTFQIVYDSHGIAMNLLGWTGDPPLWSSTLGVIGLILSSVSAFSNSFTVHEDRVTRYLGQTLVLLLLFGRMNPKKKKKHGSLLHLLDAYLGLKPTAYCILSLVLVRMGSVYNRCREEQGRSCEPSGFTLPFASLPDSSSFKSIRFLLAVACLLGIYSLFRWFLNRNGHLLGHGWTVLGTSVGSTLCVAAVCAYWVTLWLPESVAHKYSVLVRVILPSTVYVMFLIFGILYAINPVLYHVESASVGGFTLKKDVIDKRLIFEQVKRNWTEVLGSTSQQRKRMVYGVASGFSGSLVALGFMATLVFCLLLGDGLISSFFAISLVLFILLELGSSGNTFVLPLWVILVQNSFYALGHHATFSSIPWEAAFIGLPGNFRFQSIQALLVLLNLNAGHILFVIFLPLVVVWSQYSQKLGCFTLHEVSDQTEYALTKKNNVVPRFWEISVQYLTLLAVKLLAVSVASAVHRRHLMVWKIFAPKFIFEGISFLVSCGSLLIVFLIVARLNHCLRNCQI